MIYMFSCTDSHRWDVFLSKPTYFSALSSQIYKKVQESEQRITELFIFVGRDAEIMNLELEENFEILFIHSSLNKIIFVLDTFDPQFERLARVIRFMNQVYEYNVFIKAAQTQVIA